MNNDFVEEQRLHSLVKKSAKRDRSQWLNSCLDQGDWQQIRKLRSSRKAKCRRLRNCDGDIVESDCWADAMAEHLERIQWHVRPLGAVEGHSLTPDLPVSMLQFSSEEVLTTVQKLRKRKASGTDDIPAEFWQAIVTSPEGLSWLVDFCNACWMEEDFPADWRCAQVISIFKKGSIEDPDNYRPISLVCIGYKTFAALLLGRLRDGGAEKRLTASQYGFRRGR